MIMNARCCSGLIGLDLSHGSTWFCFSHLLSEVRQRVPIAPLRVWGVTILVSERRRVLGNLQAVSGRILIIRIPVTRRTTTVHMLNVAAGEGTSRVQPNETDPLED
uniref:Uncharacterized protein n=1 Tax=Solanum tuberosum TaxID=4113 RepID=M1ANE7_SOLTU